MYIHGKGHAADRWREYVGPMAVQDIAKKVRRHLTAALKSGINIDITGAGHIQINPTIWAVVKPEGGRWVVITFHRGTNYAERRDI